MKRLIIALVILGSILALGSYGLFYVHSTRDELLDAVEQIRDVAEAGEREEVTRMCLEFNRLWHEREANLIKIIRHHPLDTITGVAARLPSLAQYGDMGLLMSTLDELSVYLDHIWEEEQPALRNIL